MEPPNDDYKPETGTNIKQIAEISQLTVDCCLKWSENKESEIKQFHDEISVVSFQYYTRFCDCSNEREWSR